MFNELTCCMAGTLKIFCITKNIFSHRKKNLLFLLCNMVAVQNFYSFSFLNAPSNQREEMTCKQEKCQWDSTEMNNNNHYIPCRVQIFTALLSTNILQSDLNIYILDWHDLIFTDFLALHTSRTLTTALLLGHFRYILKFEVDFETVSFYSLEPRSEVGILTYENWSFITTKEVARP